MPRPFMKLPQGLIADAAFLIVLPLSLLAVSTNWIFTSPGMVDPFIYLGYMLDLVDYKGGIFANTYYGSRLGWILPGAAVHAVLPGVAANYVLHLLVYYCSVFSLYVTARFWFGRAAAAAAAGLMGTYGYFLGSVGWDYVDGAVNAYLLLAFALLTRSLRSKQPTSWAIAAGCALAAAVYSYVLVVVLTPWIVAYALAARSKILSQPWRQSARELLFPLALGGAGLTLLFCLINFRLEGVFWFYGVSIDVARTLTSKASEWKVDGWAWLRRPSWLVVPLVAAGTAAARLLWRSPGPANRATWASRFFALFMVGCFGTFAALDAGGRSTLQHCYVTSYLIPGSFLFFASRFTALQNLSPNRRWLFLAVWCGGGALAVAGSPPLSEESIDLVFDLGLVAAAVALWAGAGARLHVSRAVTLGFALAVSASIASSFTLGLERNPNTPRVGVGLAYRFSERHSRPDAFRRLLEGAQAVREVSGGDRFRFWYSDREPGWFEFIALNSIFLHARTLMSTSFPDPGENRLGVELIALPSWRDDALDQLEESLRERNLKAKMVETRHVGEQGEGYALHFFRVANEPPIPASFAPKSGIGAGTRFEYGAADLNGADDLAAISIIANQERTSVGSCYLYFVPLKSTLYLQRDAGDGWLDPIRVGEPGELRNSQCAVDMAHSSSSSEAASVRLSLDMEFTSRGPITHWVRARDSAGQMSDWLEAGTYQSSGAEAAAE